MMLMGDEYGHTRYGNNNSYGHDTALNHFLWGQVFVLSLAFHSPCIVIVKIHMITIYVFGL